MHTDAHGGPTLFPGPTLFSGPTLFPGPTLFLGPGWARAGWALGGPCAREGINNYSAHEGFNSKGNIIDMQYPV